MKGYWGGFPVRPKFSSETLLVPFARFHWLFYRGSEALPSESPHGGNQPAPLPPNTALDHAPDDILCPSKVKYVHNARFQVTNAATQRSTFVRLRLFMCNCQKCVKRVLKARQYTLKANKTVLVSFYVQSTAITLFYHNRVSSRTRVSVNTGLCPHSLTVYQWVADSQLTRTQQQALWGREEQAVRGGTFRQLSQASRTAFSLINRWREQEDCRRKTAVSMSRVLTVQK